MNNQQMVAWFRHSAPYINAHRGKTFVLMLGGEAVGHPNFVNTIHDIALLNSLGVRLVLAVGARPQIENQLALMGLDARFHQGLRVTDKAMLEVVKQAMGSVRCEVEALLSTGLANSPMHGAGIRVVSGNFVTAKPIGVRDGVDFQHTGEVRKIDKQSIHIALQHGRVVLLPCVGYSATGEMFNLSVEDVATKAAMALGADKIIAFTEKAGVENEKGSLLKELKPGDCASLLNNPCLDNNQRNSIRACYNAVQNGVHRAHLISYANDGALLEELFTRDGSGTLITQMHYEQIREAVIDDIGGILELIEPLEQEGILVRRSRERLEAEIEHFTVIERDGTILACMAMYPSADKQTAEVACVATHPDYRNGSRASVLLHAVEQKAREMGLLSLFVLTTQTAHWFLEKGFEEEGIDALPVERKALYNFQRNSKVFFKRL
ncbi:MAG: amino-acid N-acetyltransferase [Pseudomonadales bacterium]|nr:amino-acid N-acetyltransferase [Pseudomonadales bacterium]